MFDPLKVFIIAGEPSGDALGGDVMAGLKELCSNITFQGIGGPNMQAHGLESLFDMSELSVMGLAEILPKIPPFETAYFTNCPSRHRCWLLM
jgi:lipid-A-disaccharide synthase